MTPKIAALKIEFNGNLYSVERKDGKDKWYYHLTGAWINAGEKGELVPETVRNFARIMLDKGERLSILFHAKKNN